MFFNDVFIREENICTIKYSVYEHVHSKIVHILEKDIIELNIKKGVHIIKDAYKYNTLHKDMLAKASSDIIYLDNETFYITVYISMNNGDILEHNIYNYSKKQTYENGKKQTYENGKKPKNINIELIYDYIFEKNSEKTYIEE